MALLDDVLRFADDVDCPLRLTRRYGVFSAEVAGSRGVGGNLNAALRVLVLELDAVADRGVQNGYANWPRVHATRQSRPRRLRLVRGGGLRSV